MAKYINAKTFDMVDDVFEVDDLIAETITTLNKKGYRTTYCCSGHSDPDITGIVYIDKVNYERLKDAFPNIIVIGEQIRNGVEKVVAFNVTSVQELYISFAEEYEFPTLPEDFWYEDGRISMEFPLYKEPGELYPEEVIKLQIERANLELLKWAKSLEYAKTIDSEFSM